MQVTGIENDINENCSGQQALRYAILKLLDDDDEAQTLEKSPVSSQSSNKPEDDGGWSSELELEQSLSNVAKSGISSLMHLPSQTLPKETNLANAKVSNRLSKDEGCDGPDLKCLFEKASPLTSDAEEVGSYVSKFSDCPSGQQLTDDILGDASVFSFFPKTRSDPPMYGPFAPVIDLQQKRPNQLDLPVNALAHGLDENLIQPRSMKSDFKSSLYSYEYSGIWTESYMTLSKDHFKPLFQPYVSEAEVDEQNRTNQEPTRVFSTSGSNSTGGASQQGIKHLPEMSPALMPLTTSLDRNIAPLQTGESMPGMDFLAKIGLSKKGQGAPDLQRFLSSKTLIRNDGVPKVLTYPLLPTRDVVETRTTQHGDVQSKTKKKRNSKRKKKAHGLDATNVGIQNLINPGFSGGDVNALFQNTCVMPLQAGRVHGSMSNFLIEEKLKGDLSISEAPQLFQHHPVSLVPNASNTGRRSFYQSRDIIQKLPTPLSKLVLTPPPECHEHVEPIQSELEKVLHSMKRNQTYPSFPRYNCPPKSAIHYENNTPSTISRLPPYSKVISAEELEKQMILGCSM